jgi:transposase
MAIEVYYKVMYQTDVSPEVAMPLSSFSLEQLLPGFTISHVRTENTTLTVTAHAAAATATCPSCGQVSARVHSHYIRSPRDLPISDYTVQLRLHVRRFRCRNATCPRATFAERLPLVRPWAQQTVRRRSALQALALALSGEAGARLSQPLQLHTSPATLIRTVRRLAPPVAAPPRQIGVDDWAVRKGRVYGTLIVDLERHRPIELLPDRTAATLAQWLRDRPSVELITRDRRTSSIRAMTEGAPEATQVTDRWHLLANLRDAVERLLRRLHRRLRIAAKGHAYAGLARPPQQRTATELAAGQAHYHHRLERYEAIQALVAQGLSYREIARRLHLSWPTVQRYAQAEQAPVPEARRPLPSLLDPYLTHLHQRWQEGTTNASQLWREIQHQGYAGGYRQVARWVQQLRGYSKSTTPHRYRPTTQAGAAHIGRKTRSTREAQQADLPAPRQLAWLLVRAPDTLDAMETNLLIHLKQVSEVAQTYELVQEFQTMVRTRTPEPLDQWLTDCAASGIREIRTFAAGIEQDYAAVRAALSLSASNGQTEGQVNRLKFIKRQGYGRAKFDLLRQRVLAAP